MVSRYLLRPLRTIEEALRDIERLREYWEGRSGTIPSWEATAKTSDAAAHAGDAKQKRE
jgi:hypothetical protein